MEKEIEKKLAGSLTANTVELVPFLPYLLKDIWELGSNSEDMIKLIKDYIPYTDSTKILDLACGKGAVSINICKQLNIYVKGIDIIPEFISYGRKKAEEYKISDICDFEVNEINSVIDKESNYDIVILGAVGNVLGDQKQSLEKLKKVIKSNGYILLDDAYLTGNQEDIKNRSLENYEYLTLAQWKQVFLETNLEIINILVNKNNTNKEINEYNNQQIKKRANELIKKYPEKKEIFEDYMENQLNECDDLANTIKGVTFLLKNK